MRYLVVLLLALTFSCNNKELKIGDQNITVHRNITYGTEEVHKFDIYFPQQISSASKTFIFVHGGGWRSGEKESMTAFMLQMMESFPNDAFLTMDYTLADENNFGLPQQTDDIQQLIGFLQENSEKYAVPTRYVLVGYSAGGHLASLYAFRYRNPQVEAVVNIAGPIDLTDSNFRYYPDIDFVENKLVNPEAVKLDTMSKAEFVSPVYWMKDSEVKLISFFGSHDEVIPLSQKSILDDLISESTLNGESHEYSGDHHNWQQHPHQSEILAKIRSFLK